MEDQSEQHYPQFLRLSDGGVLGGYDVLNHSAARSHVDFQNHKMHLLSWPPEALYYDAIPLPVNQASPPCNYPHVRVEPRTAQ